VNFFDLQRSYKDAYPDKLVSFEFDEKCYRLIEIILSNGKPNDIHHCECDKVKVSVEGILPQYIPILPHRFSMTVEYAKNLINSK